MQSVLVIDRNKNPLMPCHPARARKLLNAGKAAVFRRYPFTIILTEREGGDTQPVALKLDPGSKETGIALVADTEHGARLVWGGVIEHHAHLVADALLSRRSLRRSRRQRKTRYRPARWQNRKRSEGWLTPSATSRLSNIQTWVSRLTRYAPVSRASLELVKFDTHAMQNAEISGVEYQQGELMGYEVREYLLEKWGRKCAYCGAKDTPLEVEHITPKSRGGSNRVSNLTLACRPCNQKKGSQTAAEFGHPDIQKIAKLPLKDAAAVNIIRWALFRFLADYYYELPMETGTGARTKYNRVKQGYPKDHWIDAACVGKSGECVRIDPDHIPLRMRAMGRQKRQMCSTDKYGFPSSAPKGDRVQFGFQTGDIVRAELPKGKYAGVHVGRIRVRTSGAFTMNNLIPVNQKYCRILHRSDGYRYEQSKGASSQC